MLVVSLLNTPAATAALFVRERVHRMMIWGALIEAFSAVAETYELVEKLPCAIF